MFKSASVVYSVNRPDPHQLDVIFVGESGSNPKVTQISWLTKTNNGWSMKQAADDVGIDLRDYKEVKRDVGFEPTTRFFVNKRDPRMRAILSNDNGSRSFRLEHVL